MSLRRIQSGGNPPNLGGKSGAALVALGAVGLSIGAAWAYSQRKRELQLVPEPRDLGDVD